MVFIVKPFCMTLSYHKWWSRDASLSSYLFRPFSLEYFWLKYLTNFPRRGYETAFLLFVSTSCIKVSHYFLVIKYRPSYASHSRGSDKCMYSQCANKNIKRTQLLATLGMKGAFFFAFWNFISALCTVYNSPETIWTNEMIMGVCVWVSLWTEPFLSNAVSSRILCRMRAQCPNFKRSIQ